MRPVGCHGSKGFGIFSFRALALIVLVSVGLTACSRIKERANQDSTVGPNFYSSVAAVCSLLKKGDLEGATGLTFRPGADIETLAFGDVTGVTKCVYMPGPEGGPRAPTVSAVVYAYGKQIYDHQKKTYKALGIRNVNEVGDEAFFVPAGQSLFVLAGNKIVGVQVTPIFIEPGEDLQERSRRLAAKMIERLR